MWKQLSKVETLNMVVIDDRSNLKGLCNVSVNNYDRFYFEETNVK